jgi:hypothetical protein
MRNAWAKDAVWGSIVAVCVIVIFVMLPGALRGRAQAATIDELTERLDEAAKANKLQYNVISSCQAQSLLGGDSTQVTMLYDPSMPSDSHGPTDAPLDLIRPGLAAALAPFLAPSSLNPQPQRPRWFVAGRVLPFVAGDPAGARFAWIDVQTQKIEVREAMQVSFQ